MAAALFRPLTPQWGMQKHWTDGSRMHDVAAEFISVRTDIDWSAQIKEWFDNWSALGWFCR